MIVFYVIIFLLILTLIVAIHELGHFMTAKKFGVLCREYAIGMGPKIWSKKIGETVYSIRAIPIGGFVQMAGEDEEDFEIQIGNTIEIVLNDQKQIESIYLSPDDTKNSDEKKQLVVTDYDLNSDYMFLEGTFEDTANSIRYELSPIAVLYDQNESLQIAPVKRRFWALSPLKKIVVLVAGPFMNVVLALVAFIAMGIIFGNTQNIPTVGNVVVNSPAANAGLQKNDEIISIDGTPITSFTDATTIVQASPEIALTMEVLRNEQVVTLTLTPAAVVRDVQAADGTVSQVTVGQLGIEAPRTHDPITAVTSGVGQAVNLTGQVFGSLAMLFTGGASVNQLSGPIGIAAMTGNIIEASGIAGLFFFTGFLSINIGLLNLLPFPALDGGRIVFALYELIARRRPNRKFETGLNIAGFLILMGLFVYIAFNDIIRLAF